MTGPRRILRWEPHLGPLDRFVAHERGQHPGEVVDVSDGPLADALVADGAAVGRRSLLMALDPLSELITAERPGGRGLEVGPLAGDPARLAPALVAAFPPEHPDHDPAVADLEGAELALASYVAGEVIGPFLAEASSVATVDGLVVGGLVLNRMPSDPTFPGGPWVTEVFVDPAHQGLGIGAALFARAVVVLEAAGEPRLGLSVQVDNPAQHVYARLGFAVVSRWARITL